MSFSILKPGVLDTIQDLGRNGYSHWGINPGGAMDRFAAQVANIMVGNARAEAVLEMHFPAAQIFFQQNAFICITGGDFDATINNEPIAAWQPVVVRKNSVLHFPRVISGARVYLAIHGGFDTPQWLGSRSTNLKAKVGGLNGERLQKNDLLHYNETRMYFPVFFKSKADNIRVLPWRANIAEVYNRSKVLITEGPEMTILSDSSKQKIPEQEYKIHPLSDRMGYRAESNTLEISKVPEMVSNAVGFGTVQLLPGGNLMILMADHQTSGGYPRIANVVSASLPKLAQLKAGDKFQFEITTLEHAFELQLQQAATLDILEKSASEKLNSFLCTK